MEEKNQIAISLSDFKLIIDKRINDSIEISVKEPALKILQEKITELELEEKK